MARSLWLPDGTMGITTWTGASWSGFPVDGVKIANNGNLYMSWVHWQGAGAGAYPFYIDIQTPAVLGGHEVEERRYQFNHQADQFGFAGPFDPAIYNQPVGHADAGMMYIDFDDDGNGYNPANLLLGFSERLG